MVKASRRASNHPIGNLSMPIVILSLLLSILMLSVQSVSAQSVIVNPPGSIGTFIQCNALTITNPTNWSTINDSTPTISGTKTSANYGVDVYINNQPVGTSPESTSCSWSVTVDSPLQDGTYTIDASPDTACEFCSVTSVFSIDTVPPTPPELTSPVSGIITKDTQPTVTGTATDQDVQVRLDRKPIEGSIDYSMPCDCGEYVWSFHPNEPLSEGTHRLSAITTDSAGNSSPESKEIEITIDTIPAAIKRVDFSKDQIAEIDADTEFEVTINFDDPMDQEASPNISFIPDVSSSLEPLSSKFTSENTFVIKYMISDADIEASDVAVQLIYAVDLAGNNLDSQNVFEDDTFDIDTLAPSAPEITNPPNLSTTDTLSPTIMGIGEVGSTVTVYDDSTIIGTAVVGDDQAWTLNSPVLEEGTHVLHATTTDKAGNVSPDSLNTTVDVLTASSLPPGTVLNPEISLNLDSATSYWDSPFHASGKTRGYSIGDTVTISWGDGSSTTGIPISQEDGSWGPVEQSYSMSSLIGVSEGNGVKNTVFAWLMSDKIARATSASVDVTIMKHPTTLTVTLSDFDAEAHSVSITGKLTDTITGKGLGKSVVKFAIGSLGETSSLATTTTEEGTYSTTLTDSLLVEQQSVLALFDGSDLYTSSDESAVLSSATTPKLDGGLVDNGNSQSTEDNRPPIPVATSESTKDMVKLDGRSSMDPDGDELTYNWMQVSGPPVELSSPDSASPSFVPPQTDTETELQFRLIVTDGIHQVAADVSTIVSPSPKVNFLANPIVYGGIAAAAAGAVGSIAAAKHFFKRPKFPVLMWDIHAPSKIRVDGTAYVDIGIKNVGESDAKNLKIELTCQDSSIDCGPSQLIETLMPWQTKNLSFAVSQVGSSAGPYNVHATMQGKWVPKKELVALVASQEVRVVPKKEANFSLTSTSIQVGILKVTDNQSSGKSSSAAYSAARSWLEMRHFKVREIELNTGSSLSLQDFLDYDTVLIFSSDSWIMSSNVVSILEQYLGMGKGLVVFGTGVDEHGQLTAGSNSEAAKLYKLMGYDEKSTRSVSIVNNFGLRVTGSGHPITQGLEAGDVFKLPGQISKAIVPTVSTGQVIAEQLVAIKSDSSSVDRATIPAVTANEVLAISSGNAQGRLARALHFNVETNVFSGIVPQLLERAILWTSNIGTEKITGKHEEPVEISLKANS